MAGPEIGPVKPVPLSESRPDGIDMKKKTSLFFDKKTSETVNFSQLPNNSDWQANSL